MRLATVRHEGRTVGVRVDGDDAIVLDAADVGEVLARSGSAVAETGEVLRWSRAEVASLVIRPGKVICAGLNYRSHLVALGIPVPEHPTLFAKFATTLIGANDPIVLPEVTKKAIWESELTVVMGAPIGRGTVTADQALGAVGGYTVANDVTMRDWQRHSTQWLPGKAFDASTPVGPVLVTPEEIDHARDLAVTCSVDAEQVQHGRTSDLLFTPTDLILYITQFASLEPGDLILTGTPTGAGPDATTFLEPGQLMRSVIEGIGECSNPITAPTP